MIEHYDDYLIPQWAICPLEYGPVGHDLTEEELAALDRFQAKLPAGAVFEWGDTWFSYRNDMTGPVGGEVVKLSVYAEKGNWPDVL